MIFKIVTIAKSHREAENPMVTRSARWVPQESQSGTECLESSRCCWSLLPDESWEVLTLLPRNQQQQQQVNQLGTRGRPEDQQQPCIPLHTLFIWTASHISQGMDSFGGGSLGEASISRPHSTNYPWQEGLQHSSLKNRICKSLPCP